VILCVQIWLILNVTVLTFAGLVLNCFQVCFKWLPGRHIWKKTYEY